MVTVSYTYQFNYREFSGRRYPILQLSVSNPGDPEQAVDIDAYLDSGAERSLFTGSIARAVGLDLLSGTTKKYTSTAGSSVEARLHRVKLSHPNLGNYNLEIGFSVGDIQRNLLGRDFFNEVQIGFRERHFSYYVTPTP